jgi:hypothetical protein
MDRILENLLLAKIKGSYMILKINKNLPRKNKEAYNLFGIGFILTHSSCYTERRNIKREGKGAVSIPVTN